MGAPTTRIKPAPAPKRAKTARKTAKRRVSRGKTVREGGEAIIRRNLEHLEQVLDACEATLAGGVECKTCGVPVVAATPALANSSASVARSIAYLQDAIRKDEKHKAQQVLDLTPEQEDEVLLDYLEDLEPVRREKFLARLNELQGESVLG